MGVYHSCTLVMSTVGGCGGGHQSDEPHPLQVKRKLNLETDHQYIAESLPVGRGKARNPAKGTGSAPPNPHPKPAQPRAGCPGAPLCCPQAGLQLWACP